MAWREPGRPDQAGPAAGGCRSAAVHLGRRVHLRHPLAGCARRPERSARRGHERHGAAHRARLPGADGGARPVRLRVRDQVGHRHRGDDVRGGLRLLGAAGLVAAGAVKTESRIDVPAAGASLAPGRIAVAGVAWAQHKGIAAVEVRLNGGPWREARLATVPGIDTWRQWVWEWTGLAGQLPDRSPLHRRDRLHPDRRPGETPSRTVLPATPRQKSRSAAREPAAWPPARAVAHRSPSG